MRHVPRQINHFTPSRSHNTVNRNKQSSKSNMLKKLSLIIIILTVFAGIVISTENYIQIKQKWWLALQGKTKTEWCDDGYIEYMLERHDHESNHGDVCRKRTNDMFVCPETCRDAGDKPPWCVMIGAYKPCRVPRESWEYAYKCDRNGGEKGVCVKVNEENNEIGKYQGSTCDNACGNKKREYSCKDDWDCSLSGICTNGKCICDAWADGIDCSYLKFQPLNRDRIGYIDEKYSSWGGNAVFYNNTWHLFAAEIKCRYSSEKRCGLNLWQTHSQVTHATSSNVDGPYARVKPVITTYSHNPTLHSYNSAYYLYYISKYDGPIKVVSTNDLDTWSSSIQVSDKQNPAPFINQNGTLDLYYRDDYNLPKPSCSDEGIGKQTCPSPTSPCQSSLNNPIFKHTAEDPSIFQDIRGNYHMLLNTLPYKCVPKYNQGGHAWSRDGIHWSEPRVGAFNTTISYYDDDKIKSFTCERRERPQMILHPDTKVPYALVSAVTNCDPVKDRDFFGWGNAKYYRGGDDSFTIVQLMNQDV